MDGLEDFPVSACPYPLCELVVVINRVFADLDHALYIEDWIGLQVVLHRLYRLNAHTTQ